MLNITATVDAGLLEQMGQRLSSPRLLLDAAGDALIEYEKEAFSSRGFGQWEGDDPVTVAGKGHGRVLIDTGSLFRDLTSHTSLSFTGDSVTLSTDKVAAIMAKRGSRGAPPRNPAPKPSRRHVERWADQILDALLDGAVR